MFIYAYAHMKICMHGFINSGEQYTQWHQCKCERTVIGTGQSIRIITSYHTRTTALKLNIKLKTCDDNTISVGYLENHKLTHRLKSNWGTWRRTLQYLQNRCWLELVIRGTNNGQKKFRRLIISCKFVMKNIIKILNTAFLQMM